MTKQGPRENDGKPARSSFTAPDEGGHKVKADMRKVIGKNAGRALNERPGS